jgi:predicted MFS family arabinose efflux permease
VPTTIPAGARSATDGEGLRAIVRSYAALFENRSLRAMYVYWTLYARCAFGSAAHASALVISRGFTAENLSMLLAAIGITFIVTSLTAGELLGRFKSNLRVVIAVFAILFCLA